jgi:hypothetical protein
MGKGGILPEIFKLAGREAPLLANFNALQSTIRQHAVDGDAFDFKQILYLLRG